MHSLKVAMGTLASLLHKKNVIVLINWLLIDLKQTTHSAGSDHPFLQRLLLEATIECPWKTFSKNYYFEKDFNRLIIIVERKLNNNVIKSA